MIAAAAGVITPVILVADTCGLSSAGKILTVQVFLVLTALATLLQLSPVFHRIGSGLSVIMGISFTYIPTLQATSGESGLPTILSAEIVGGIAVIVSGMLVKRVRPLFPPLVTGTVIFTTGLPPCPTTVKCMASGAGSEWFDSAKSWVVVLITLVVVVFLNHLTKGITRPASILVGMLAGYVIAYFLGIVDLSGVGSAAWVALPRSAPFDIQLVLVACVPLGIVYVVNAVQTIDDLSFTTMGDMDRMPTDRELSGGIVGQGVMSILGAFFGGLPTATYSQNVDIVTANRVINRAVFVPTTLILLVAGLVPKFASLLATTPQCVIGGATISVFTTITATGTRTIAEGGLTPHKSSVMGLSVAPDMGITQVSGCLADEDLPARVNTAFGSSFVVVAVLMAILLSLILLKEFSANG